MAHGPVRRVPRRLPCLGREFFDKPLTFDRFEDLVADLETIDIDEELGELTDEQKKRRDEIERLVLSHERYFADGPRIYITNDNER